MKSQTEEKQNPQLVVDGVVVQGQEGRSGEAIGGNPSRGDIFYAIKSVLPYYERDDKDDYYYILKGSDVLSLVHVIFKMFDIK